MARLGTQFDRVCVCAACTGEEAVLTWTLVRQGDDWRVASVQRDSDDEDSLPKSPHPRYAHSCNSPPPLSLKEVENYDIWFYLRFLQIMSR